jgi:hypothetical protein
MYLNDASVLHYHGIQYRAVSIKNQHRKAPARWRKTGVHCRCPTYGSEMSALHQIFYAHGPGIGIQGIEADISCAANRGANDDEQITLFLQYIVTLRNSFNSLDL